MDEAHHFLLSLRPCARAPLAAKRAFLALGSITELFSGFSGERSPTLLAHQLKNSALFWIAPPCFKRRLGQRIRKGHLAGRRVPEILDGCRQAVWGVPEETQPHVARFAQQPPNRACCMVMIDVQGSACARHVRGPTANGAHFPLERRQLHNLVWSDAVALLQGIGRRRSQKARPSLPVGVPLSLPSCMLRSTGFLWDVPDVVDLVGSLAGLAPRKHPVAMTCRGRKFTPFLGYATLGALDQRDLMCNIRGIASRVSISFRFAARCSSVKAADTFL